MEDGGLALLSAWESFYVIVGPSAAVLIGLQFVVMVLSAEMHALGDNAVVSAFGTPTIVHFCLVLLVSALMSAPWPALFGLDLALGVCAAVGLVYTGLVVRRARSQTVYVPVLEDWIWHAVLPLLAYIALLGTALTLEGSPETDCFVIGAALVLLLFIGIHNAWDSVVYTALNRRSADRERQS